jgi:hypothetical protein
MLAIYRNDNSATQTNRNGAVKSKLGQQVAVSDDEFEYLYGSYNTNYKDGTLQLFDNIIEVGGIQLLQSDFLKIE